MQSPHITISQIMNIWNGEDIRLISKGHKMIIVTDNRQLFISEHDNINNNGVSLFSDITRNKYRGEKDNYGCRNIYQSQQEFVVKAMNRYTHHRVSLADLGQIYNNSKTQQTIPIRKRFSSQNYQSPNRFNYNYPLKQNNQRYQPQNNQNNDQLYTQNYHNIIQSPRYQRNQIPEYKQQDYISPSSPTYLKKTVIKNNIINNIPNKQMPPQIPQIDKIDKIKLVQHDKISPQYQKGNIKFENMKSQILQKIIKQGQGKQMEIILKQIHRAADQIISKYKIIPDKQHTQKHNAFSFTDQFLDSNNKKNNNNNKIQSIQDKKSQCNQNLPKFKDDTGSISSILSNNGLKKDQFDSKDQDFCKITNVFINDAQHVINGKTDQLNNRSLGQNKQKLQQIPNKLDNKNSSTQQQQYIRIHKLNKNQSSQVLQTHTKPQQKSKQKPHTQSNQIQTYPQYQLQRLTSQPVKIITNLQQAKIFDPQVVKYTQLKVKYIETRTISPQIIRIPSPLRFRRKQDVIKQLVANHVVQKQSASIQF